MIKPLKEVLDVSLSTINKYQKGVIKQIKTNRVWLDHQGGLVPKSFVTIFGASFGGKSTELEGLKADIMDIKINPEAKDFVWLSNAFEMTNFATTLRDIKKLTKKQFKDILNQEFSDEEKIILKAYYENKTDGRFYVNQVPQSADEFIEAVDNFLAQHTDKALVALDLDHIGLVKASTNNKKLAVDDVVEGLNMLKNKYDNFLVVLLCQANRNVLGRVKEKSNESRLRRDDVYMSDTVYHISDYLYGLQNAQFLGIEQYAKINPDKYPHLSHRFGEEKNGKVSLYTEDCIFVEVLKDRSAEVGFIDLYAIELKPFNKKEFEVKSTVIPNFSFSQTPLFDSTPDLTKHETSFANLNKAFDVAPKEDKSSPF